MIATTPTTTFRKRDMTAAWRHVDWVLIALVLGTACLGALLVFSATRNSATPYALVEKHVLFILIGTGVMAVCAAVDYQRLADHARLLYLATLAMLGAVLSPLGSVHKNIQAWFDIGPIQIQPAELAKVVTILFLAAFLGRLEHEPNLKDLGIALAILAAPMGLIMLQPDLGTTLVFVVIGLGMLLVSGVNARYLAVLVLIGITAVVGILSSDTLDQYQKERLTSFVAPEAASSGATYNTKQSQTAIASGGLTGKGLFAGPQTKGGFVPEQQTDFIFTVPGEELGFAGAATLLTLLGLIVWRVWRCALIARDRTGRLICVGVLCLLVFHIFENVGMNMGIMPVTGIPLPFVSYGGSSIITSFAAVGLVLNVHMRRLS